MNTAFLLLALYDGIPIIPLDRVRADYFSHLDMPKFLRKLSAGDIKLPITRMEASQRAMKGVHITDLAEYIDLRRAAALKELRQLTS